MDPSAPTILKCPNCDAHYKRDNWISENTFGSTQWSDGVLTNGMTGEDYDPVILCRGCNRYFAPNTSRIKNIWGFSLPKDVKMFGPGSVTVEEALQVLGNNTLLQELGTAFSTTQAQEVHTKALQSGQFQVRLIIWRKLNDEIREFGHAQFTPERQRLYLENAKALVPLIPLDDLEFDQSALLWKAEIQRNLGEFGKSLLTLWKVTHKQMRTTKWKMILLNLVRNRKLVPLAASGGWQKTVGLWRTWLF